MTSLLPEATTKPCNDCPWRRNAVKGWLGPHSAGEWVELAHSDTAIACHLTIKEESWDEPGIRQCAGASIYRANVGKVPRNPAVARGIANRDTIFSSPTQFKEYHYMDKPLLANAIECFECDEVFDLDRDMPQAEAEDEYCPNDSGHAVTAIHVSGTPLGLPGVDDKEYFNFGSEQYEYVLQDIKS